MSATVTLKIVEGPLSGAEFVYHAPALCTVGRSRECSLQLPNNLLHGTVSRHHCLLEIAPPVVRVCDLGSLNGTFVNGELIGQRAARDRADLFGIPFAPDRPLEDGDELRVGENVFRVCVTAEKADDEPAACGDAVLAESAA
jgi:pSer/pThr/pTyr-binding forkhead associated (FHA) protein